MNNFHVSTVLCHLESSRAGPTSMLTKLRMCRNAVHIPKAANIRVDGACLDHQCSYPTFKNFQHAVVACNTGFDTRLQERMINTKFVVLFS